MKRILTFATIVLLFCAISACSNNSIVIIESPATEGETDGDNSGQDSDKLTGIPEDMAAAFPDPNFRAYVMENFDEDGDGKISKEEAEAVKSITISGYSKPNNEQIVSLEGIQYFANLGYLVCSFCPLKSLDISQNTALWYLNCTYTQLTNLDITKNAALKDLMCFENELTNLDVSQCRALEFLSCGSNQLTSLNLSKNLALEYLGCERNQLTALDVSNNVALRTLICTHNQLKDIDVSNTSLTQLACSYNQLTSLDISKTDLGNSTESNPLYCGEMETLKTLYIKKGWNINGITINRNATCIPDQTEIVFVN